jgi:transposase
VLSGANAHDKTKFGATLDALMVKRPSPERVLQHLCADKGYDYRDIRFSAVRRGYVAHIPRRGTKPKLAGQKNGRRSRRWVIERTNRWHNLFRRLKIRYEVHASNYLAFVQFASAIICFRRARAS